MGCWTRFRKTWRPGYGEDVIDPNKAFDFERRLILLKKIIFIVVLLAVLIALICVVVFTSTSTASSNNAVNNLTAGQQSQQPLTFAKEENISVAAIFPSFASMHEENINGSVVFTSKNDSHVSKNSSLTLSSEIPLKDDNTNSSIVQTSEGNNSTTSIETHDPSELSCSADGSGLDCVGLSKSFKTVMTFGNNRKHNESDAVEGYIMVKMNNSKWHPYCFQHWTLEMGYKLCRGLGFHQLLKLETIEIEQLKQRITRPGKDVSLHSADLLVVTTTDKSVSHPKSNDSQYDCSAGYISCN